MEKATIEDLQSQIKNYIVSSRRAALRIHLKLYDLQNRFQDGEMVSFRFLESLPVSTKLVLGPGCHAYKMKHEDEDRLFFKTIFLPGSFIRPHKHDCREIVTPEKNGILNFEEIGINFGESGIEIPPHKNHTISNPANIKQTAIVQFFRPLKV